MALEIRSISKRFGAVQANDSISLTIEPGTLHAVLGENGAGKSTLMKILSGFQGADEGEVWLDGSRLVLGSPRRAIAAGIGMLHQDPLVALPLTVLENFLFGRQDGMTRREGREKIGEIAGRIGFALDPDRITRTLSIGERQQLEIVRLLSLGVTVLILDEPTSGITTDQRVELFAALRRLASDGLIVLFVSHKLEEVEMLCSSVTVIRRGAVTGDATLPCPESQLVEMMFGKVIAPADRPPLGLGQVMVDVSDLTARHGRQRIEGAHLDLRGGEVVGLAGLEGSGQLPLLRAMAGIDRPVSGSFRLDGLELSHASLREHIAAGVHFLPAGRLEEGLFPGLTISEHLTLAHPSSGKGFDRATDESRAQAAIDRYRIKGTPRSEVEGLSGGNQQRVLLAMMPDTVRLLLLEQPTRGLDIESADMVWGQILARREQGTAIVFASADLDELVRYSDRVAVCFDGRIIAIEEAAGLDSDRLGARIGGKVAS
jgi:simple sugar transport system ATP-binding protein